MYVDSWLEMRVFIRAFVLYGCISIDFNGMLERRSLCVDLLTWLRGKGVGSLSPLSPSPPSPLSLVFSFFLSRLPLHAQCHILIPRSSKLIRDNARLMETPPPAKMHPSPLLFPSLLLTPTLCLCFVMFSLPNTIFIATERFSVKVSQTRLVTCIDYLTTNE